MRRFLLLAVVGTAFLAAPAARAAKVRDDVDLVQRDVLDLQQRVADLQAGQQAILASLAEMRQALGLDDPGRSTPADLAARMGGLEQDMRALFERQGEADTQVSTLTERLDAVFRHRARLAQSESLLPGAPTLGDEAGEDSLAWETPPAAPADSTTLGDGPGAAAPAEEASLPLLDPEELYQAARADYGRGAYDLAISGFEEFLEIFQGSDLADNAQYWIGECHWAQGRHAEALAAFEGVAASWPQGDKVPDAEFKKALALLELNRTADGILQLQRVRDAWPETSAARLAQQKLQGLGLM